MRVFLFTTLLCGGLMCPAFADEAAQVRMLKQLFAQPVERWEQLLWENRSLLDREFFQRIDQRLRWDEVNCQVEDAMRFAMVGDLALKVLGETPRFASTLQGSQRPRRLTQTSDPLSVPVRPAESRRAIRNARAAVRQGRIAMAERLFREALIDHPKSLTGWLELARFHGTHGKFDLAAQEYRQATRLWPRRGETWLLRGKAAEASFDRFPSWEAVDEARLCYGKAIRLGESGQSLLARVNCKARALAKQIIDLEEPGSWELQTGQYQQYMLGEAYGDHPLAGGDPISGGSRVHDTGEWYPLVSLAGEDLASYLERSYGSSEDGDSSLVVPEYLVAGGLWRGHLVWIRSESPDTRLCLGGRVIGRLHSPRERWPLGRPYARFRERETDLEIQLFRSSMAEVGLEILKGKVAAVYLMEPGRLRVNLQRLPRYREL